MMPRTQRPWFSFRHRADGDDGNDSDQQRHDVRPRDVAENDVEGMEVDQRRIVVDDQTGVLQPQKGDEQADGRQRLPF